MKRSILFVIVLFAWLLNTSQVLGQCTGTPFNDIAITDIQNVTCNGGADGSITVEVDGGEAPFVYELVLDQGGAGVTPLLSSPSTTDTEYTFSGLPAETVAGGNYRIIVKTSNSHSSGIPILVASCSERRIDDIDLTQPDAIVINTGVVAINSNNRCIAPFDGSIDATGAVSGGNGSYEYSIDGTNFQASPIFSNLEHNTYTLSVRDANGCVETESITVPDNRVAPTTTISPDPANVCISTDLVLNGNPAGGSGTYTHSWTGDIASLSDPNIQGPTFNSATAGTFNLAYTVTDDNGCTATDNITVTVVDDPDLSLPVSVQTTPICSGTGTNIQVGNSESGYNYTLRDAGNNVISGPVAGNNGTIDLPTGNLTTTTTFNILVTNGLCVDQQLTNTATVTVVPAPDVTLPVSPEVATLCENTGTNIFVDNSENGFIYQLREGTTPIGPTQTGDGARLTFPTGNLATTTTFNVTVDNLTCPPQQLNTTATVNVVNNPDLALTVTAASPEVCPGTGTNILIDGTEVGYSYQLRNDAGDIIITTPAVAGTGGQISLATGNLAAATTFNVLVTNGICVDQELATLVTVNLHTPPSSATLSGDATICEGSSTNLAVAIVDGTAPYSFTLSDGTPVSGYSNGDFVSVTPTSTTTYTIVGDVTDANGCTVAGSGSATVTVDPSPDISLGVSAISPAICENTGTTIVVSGSEAGVDYQLRNDADDSLIGTAVTSTGGDLGLPTGNLTGDMTFNVVADNGSCPPVELTQTVSVTVAENPDVSLTVEMQDNEVCSGSGTNVIVRSSQSGYTYELRDNVTSALLGTAITSTGGDLSLPTGALTANQTFKVLVSNGGICADAQLTQTPAVTVNQGPTSAVLSGGGSICNGSTASLAVNISGGTGPYDFTLSDGTSFTGHNGTDAISVSPTTTTTYTIVGGVTDANGCTVTGTGSATVTVNDPPTLAELSGDNTICEGETANLLVTISGGTGPYTIEIDNGIGVVNNYNSGNPIPTPALTATTTYNLVGNITDANGCTVAGSGSATITVVPPPVLTLTVTAQDATICSGTGTSILVDGTENGFSYQLRNAADNSAIGSAVIGNGGQISLPTGNLTATTNFEVTVSNTTCPETELTNTAQVTVESSPNISLGVSADDPTICENGSTNIVVVNSELGVDYQLRNDADDSLIGVAVPGTGSDLNLPTGNLTGDITFNVLADNGSCPPVELTQTVSVTVAENPDVSLTVEMQDTEVCSGGGTNVIVRGSQTGYTYQLRNDADDSLIGSVVAGTGADINLPTGTLTANQTFNVLVSNGGICTDAQLTQTPAVTVNEGPTSTSLSDDGDICAGENANLQVTINGGAQPYTITLDNGIGTLTGYNSGQAIPVSPITTTTYNLVGNVVDANGCTVAASGSTEVVVNSVTADAGADQNIAFDTNIQLVGSASGGPGSYSYRWEPVDSLQNPLMETAQNPQTKNLRATTNFILTVTDLSTLCTDIDIVQIGVTGGPLLATVSATPNEICEGESTQLEVVPSGGDGTYTITWDNAALLDDDESTTPIATPTATTTFQVTVEDGAGQTITRSVLVTVNPLPTVNTDPADQAVCEGQNATFTVAATGTGLTYQWQEDTGGGFADLAGETGSSLNVFGVTLAQSGNQYQVVVTSDEGCDITSASATLTVPNPQVTTQPTDQTVCTGQDATFNVVASGSGLTFQWQEDNGGGFADLVGETNPSLIVNGATLTQSGNQYQVVVTDANGCSTTSSAAELTVTNAPDATFTYDNTDYCPTGTVSPNTLPPTAGGMYSASGGLTIDATTGEIDLTSGTLGTTYFITYEVGNLTCNDSHTVSLTITNPSDPGFNYGGATTFCRTDANPTVTITGDAGGSFSAIPAGLSIVPNGTGAGAIDLSASTAGIYNVTYFAPGTCNTDSTISVTITDPAASTLTYPASDFCKLPGATTSPTSPSPVSGSFSAGAGLSINATTGAIDIENSTAGNYTVTYTSSTTCASPATFDLTISDAPVVNAGADGASCTLEYQLTGNTPGAGTGTWTVTAPAPGSTTVSFDDPTSPTATVTVDIPGRYTFQWEIDNGACPPATDEVEIDFTDPLVVTHTRNAPDRYDNADCTGSGGSYFGSYEVSVSGGSGNYSYLWAGNDWNGNPINETDPYLNGGLGFGIAGGIYTLTVTDDDTNCDTTVVAVIGNLDLNTEGATPNVEVTTTASCDGSATGDIEVSIPASGDQYLVRVYDSLGVQIDESSPFIGNAATYQYSVSTAGTNLAAGTYYIEVSNVTSNEACRTGDTVVIAAIATPVITLVNQTDPSCVGNTDGTIEVSVAGGSGTYSFQWFQGSVALSGETSTIITRGVGEYQIVVTDDITGCTVDETYELFDPPLATGPNAQTPLPSITCNTFTIQWDEVSGAEYRVDVATDANFGLGTFVTGYENEDVPAGTFQLNVTGLSPETDYFYRVRSVLSGCVSDNSDTITVTTEGAPATTATSAAGIACDAFTARWVSVTGATNYFIDVANDVDFTSILADYNNEVVPTDTFLVVNLGISSGTEYFYRVRTETSCGISVNSDTISVTTLGGTVVAPTNVIADNPTCDGFRLTWDAATGALNYRVEASDDGFVTTTPQTVSGTTYTFTGLDIGQTYDYRITSIGLCGDGNTTAVASFATRTAPTATDQTPVVCEDAGTPGEAIVDLTALELSINGGAGATIDWFEDNTLASQIPAPTSFSVNDGDIVYAQVTENGCTNVAEVTYTVRSLPAVTDQNLAVCEDTEGSGTATVDLTDLALQSAIDGGAGSAFTWYTEATLTTQVADPTVASVNSSTTLYAEVSDGSCISVATVSYTVNAITPVSISGLNNAYCETDGAVNINPGLGGGTFTGPGITDNGNGTADFDPAIATVGTHTITYEFTNANGCISTATEQVVVNDCSTGPVPNFNASPTTVCVGETVRFEDASSGATTYNWDFGAGASPATATGVGFHDVTYSVAGPVTVSLTIDQGLATDSTETKVNFVTVTSSAAVSLSYPTDSYCPTDGDPTPSVAPAGGTFSSTPGLVINATTGVIEVANSNAGTYEVTYAIGGTCSPSGTFDVTIQPEESADFSYPANIFCTDDANPVATISGTTGGTFSSTSGLPINTATGEIDLATASAGAHSVTYETNGPCQVSQTIPITINAAPDASFSYSSGTYCVSDPTNPTPSVITPGGTFTADPGIVFDDVTTGEIDLVASTVGGPYLITYSFNTGPCPTSETFSVTIASTANATFSYAVGPYCQGDIDPTPAFPPGASAGTFTASPAGLIINATTGEVDLSASNSGTYTVENEIISGSCNDTQTSSIEILDDDDPSFSYASTSFCKGQADPSPTVDNPTIPPGTFSSATLLIDSNTGVVNVAGSSIGTHNITYTTGGTCQTDSTIEVTINAEEIADFNYGGVTVFCQNEPTNPTATIVGNTGGTFSGTTGLVIDAASGEINLLASTASSHTVTYDTDGPCSDVMTLAIEIAAVPVAMDQTPPAICEDSDGSNLATVDLTELQGDVNGDAGVTYQWFSDPGLTNDITASASSYVVANNQTVFVLTTNAAACTDTAEVTYTVTPTNLCGCGFDLAAFNVVPTDASCIGAEDGQIQVFTETSSIAPPSRFRFRYQSLDDLTILSPWDSTSSDLTGIGFVVFDPDTVLAGNYRVIIEDRFAGLTCTPRDTIEVQVGVQNEIEVSVQAETCTTAGAISLEIPDGCLDDITPEYVMFRTNDDGIEEVYNDFLREPPGSNTFTNLESGDYRIALYVFDESANADTLASIRTFVPNNCSIVGGDTTITTCSLDGRLVIPSTTLTECGASTGVLELTVQGGESEEYTFTIQSSDGIVRTETGLGSVTFTDVPIGRYIYTVVTEDGRDNCSASARVGDNGIVFTTESILPDCDDPDQTADLTVTIDTLFSAASAPYDVYAVFGNDTISTTLIDISETSATLAGLSTGQSYQITVASRDENACPKTETVPVPGTGEDALAFAARPQSITCFGEFGSVTVDSIQAVDGLSLRFLLYRVDQLDAIDQATFNRLPLSYTFEQLQPGDYQIELEQQQGNCDRVSRIRSETFRIEGPTSPLEADVPEDVIATVEYPYGNIEVNDIRGGVAPYEVRIAVDPAGNSQDWVEVVNDNPAINPFQHVFMDQTLGTYQIEIRDQLGCVRPYIVSVNYTADLYIPNIFTPNGDGDNDTFRVINLDRFTSDDDKATIIITSRWGNKVFESDAYTEENFWDGGEYPDGLYFYRLNLPNGEGYTGWVEIWRGRTP
ncbi:fibronectin type III domain-containing protein [Tunicatimonas pelagia]|uniref:fibronectin type III domain-containing protein n=1 Tax=Tunicatimonas pelagia TaxID=931531 RepID=UPI00266531DB|nr:gliding motility-associated C-terminal domain-containing protein [Tunicatimonas pelagia]WKN45481.1 gliding motility-associated C-terminal domain-containing protein [Tunicatimonas pelagia]